MLYSQELDIRHGVPFGVPHMCVWAINMKFKNNAVSSKKEYLIGAIETQ